MAVAPHRRGPNGKLMTPVDRETDVLWGYVAVGPRLLAFISPFLAQTRGRFALCAQGGSGYAVRDFNALI